MIINEYELSVLDEVLMLLKFSVSVMGADDLEYYERMLASIHAFKGILGRAKETRD